MDNSEECGSVFHPYMLQCVEETNRELGRGRYADVVEVKLMGLSCAAKKLHFSRKIHSKTALEKIALQMERECVSVLAKLRHPNILQFIGVYFEPGQQILPVLVHELMPLTLGQCFDQYGLLPDSTSYSILRDIAAALCFLHTQCPPIVHGALSANNVLVGKDMSAKLADVSLAKFLRQLPHHNSLQEGPMVQDSARYYLPPEACTSSLNMVDTKADIFSYGILMLHTMSGRLPIPMECRVSTSGSCSLSEADLRQEYLSEIGEKHPITDLILQCIEGRPSSRPNSINILQKVSQLASKVQPLYANSLEMLHKIENDEDERSALKIKIKDLSPQSSINGGGEMNELERLRQTVSKLSAQNVALRASLSAKVALEPNTNNLTESSPRLRRTSRHISLKKQATCTPTQLTKGRIKWTKCADIPVGMFQAQSIVLGSKVYVGGGNTGDNATDALIFEYDPHEDSWTVMPSTPVTCFALGKMEGEVVIVGGKDRGKVSSAVYVFDRFTQRWKESLPPLNTARYNSFCMSYQSSLITFGGLSENGSILCSIEVIQPYTFQWFVTGYLSRTSTLSYSSPVSIHNTCYFLGGYRSTTASSSTAAAHCASLSELLSSLTNGMTPSVFSKLPDTPHLQTTAASIGGCLLAIGGTSSPYTMPVHQSVHAFNPSTKSWVYVGDLPYAACHSTTATLPNGELLVLGGWIRPGEFKRSHTVYRGCVVAKD